MGIRIHTAIGYGLNIAGMNKTVLKERWDVETAFEERSNQIVSIMSDESLDLGDRMFFGRKDDKCPFSLTKSLIYDDEFFGEDYLLLLPHPFGKNWQRYDDDIDYFHAYAFEQELGMPDETVWRQTQRAIYPYYGLMKENPKASMGIENYTIPFYLNNEDLRNTVIPFAPRHLMLYIKALELVPEENLIETYLSLRPTYAKWWS